MAEVEAARLVTVLETRSQGGLSEIQRFSHAFDGLKRSVATGLGMGIGFAAFAAGMAGLRSVTDTLKNSVIGLNSSLQLSQVGFQTMLGSEAAAAGMMTDLAAYARNTSFELQGLSKIAGRFLAQNFAEPQIIPLLEMIGNAVAAVGGGEEDINGVSRALAQMNAVGKVTAQDMNQLSDRMIPAWQILADAIGKPVAETRKLAEEGKISAAVFLQAFEGVARGKWGDAQKNQADTFRIALSNAKEGLQAGMATGFKPFFTMLNEGIIVVRDFTKTERFDRWVKAVHAGSIIATTAIRAFVENVRPGLAAVGGFFDRLADSFGIPALTGVEKVAEKIPYVFGEAAQGIGDTVGKASLDAAEAAISGWDKVLSGISEQTSRIGFQVDDIRSGYEAHLAPLEAELDILQRQKTLQDIIKRGQTQATIGGRIRLKVGEDIGQDLAIFDLQDKIKELQVMRDAAVKPLEEETKALGRQAFNVGLQRDYWQGIVEGIKDAEDAAKNLGDTVAGPGGITDALAGGGTTAAVSEVWKTRAEEIGKKLADPEFWKQKGRELFISMRDGFVENLPGWIDKGQEIAKSVLLGVATGAVNLGQNVWGFLTENWPDMKALGEEKGGQLWDGFRAKLPSALEIGKKLGQELIGGMELWIRENPGEAAGKISGAMIGGGIGWLVAGPVGMAIGSALGSEIGAWAGKHLWESDKFWAAIYDIKKFLSGLSFDLDGKTTWEKFQARFHATLLEQAEQVAETGRETGRNVGRGLVAEGPGILGNFLWAITQATESVTRIQDAGRTIVGNLFIGFAQGVWEELPGLASNLGNALNAALIEAIRMINVSAGPFSFRGLDIFPNAVAGPELPPLHSLAQTAEQAAAMNPLNLTPVGAISRGTMQGAIAVTQSFVVNGDVSDAQIAKLKEETAAAVYDGLARAAPDVGAVAR